MDIKRDDFEKQYFKKINGITYLPIYTFSKFEKDMYYDLKIEKTADESYSESLKQKETTKQPTSQEQINAQLLKDNAEQKILIAQLVKEIASLKGGTANV